MSVKSNRRGGGGVPLKPNDPSADPIEGHTVREGSHTEVKRSKVKS